MCGPDRGIEFDGLGRPETDDAHRQLSRPGFDQNPVAQLERSRWGYDEKVAIAVKRQERRADYLQSKSIGRQFARDDQRAPANTSRQSFRVKEVAARFLRVKPNELHLRLVDHRVAGVGPGGSLQT